VGRIHTLRGDEKNGDEKNGDEKNGDVERRRLLHPYRLLMNTP